MALSCNGLLFSCRISCFPRPIPAIFTLQMFFRYYMHQVCYLTFHSYCRSCAQPVSTALQRLMDKYQLTTSQINREIQQKNIPYLARHFDNVEVYIYLLELTPGEQSDVRLKRTESNHLAMTECLTIWKRKKPRQATFRALLEMLVMLRKEGLLLKYVNA